MKESPGLIRTHASHFLRAIAARPICPASVRAPVSAMKKKIMATTWITEDSKPFDRIKREAPTMSCRQDQSQRHAVAIF